MIITTLKPYTTSEIKKLQEQYDIYIKTVIDIERKICSAGMQWHYEGEKILLGEGSKQEHIWGGGIELSTQQIDFNSFINIRPSQGNNSNEIKDESICRTYEELTHYFFREVL